MGSRRRAPGQLRIIAGSLKGRKLKTLDSDLIRPTADRVREALFDILGPRVSGASFLDAYAGTGAVGIEALSRGAREVTFVEAHPAAIDLLRGNLERLALDEQRQGLTAACKLYGTDLREALPLLASLGRAFDIIFLDPPYAGPELGRALTLLGGSGILAPRCLIVAEHEAHTAPPVIEPFTVTRTVIHGRAALTFYWSPGFI